MKNCCFAITGILLAAFIGISEAGQCCLSYTDLGGTYHPAKWCDNYCCNSGVTTILNLACCDDPALASDDNVDDFCAAWFEAHIWVPVVVSIVILGAIIACLTCCCCCGCCCCRRNQPGTIVLANQQPAAGMTVVSSTSHSASYNANPSHVGYDQ